MTAIYRETPQCRPRARHRRRDQRRQPRHPRAQGGHHRHRRLDRQREFPPHVRPAPDRGILRPRRHAVVGPGRQRRARRDGDRRVAVGPLQPDRRVRHQPHQARHDRLPVRLSQSADGMPGSAVFDRARATGLRVADWQNVIIVNMLGQRFYDETGGQFTANNYNSINPYTQGAICNAENVTYKPNNWINAAMAGIGDGHNGGGPIWAIFDADAVAREKWIPSRRMSTSPAASSSAPTRSPISPGRS